MDEKPQLSSASSASEPTVVIAQLEEQEVKQYEAEMVEYYNKKKIAELLLSDKKKPKKNY